MLGPWVLLKRLELPTTTKGGIELLKSTQQLPNLATVLSHGKGIKRKKGGFISPLYQVGDKVMFKKFEYRPFYHLGEDMIICHQADIILWIQS